MMWPCIMYYYYILWLCINFLAIISYAITLYWHYIYCTLSTVGFVTDTHIYQLPIFKCTHTMYLYPLLPHMGVAGGVLADVVGLYTGTFIYVHTHIQEGIYDIYTVTHIQTGIIHTYINCTYICRYVNKCLQIGSG